MILSSCFYQPVLPTFTVITPGLVKVKHDYIVIIFLMILIVVFFCTRKCLLIFHILAVDFSCSKYDFWIPEKKWIDMDVQGLF